MSTANKRLSRGGASIRTRVLPKTVKSAAAPPAEVQAAGAPVSGASVTHRSLQRHLVSASELSFEEAIAADAPSPDDTIDLVSIARFPPGIAALLRKRTTDAFTQALQAWDSGVSTTGQSDVLPAVKDVSSRGQLGLSITPTSAEDYRIFDVCVDVMNHTEVAIIQAWRSQFDIKQHPPLTLSVKQDEPTTKGGGKGTAKGKAKAKSSSAESSLVSRTIDSTPPQETWEMPLGTIELVGVLTELPSLIEAYKTLDLENMIKSANISQLLICCFPEDLGKHFPGTLSTTPGSEIHDCVEKFLCQMEGAESPDDQLFDPSADRLYLNQCPWLWPSGITPPLFLHRERRSRPFDIYSKQEIQAVETEMIAIMKHCPQERVQLEVASALECFLQHEALQKDSSVPNADQVLSLAPDSRLVHVVTDWDTNLFDNPDDSLSDQLFGEEFHITEADIMEAMRGNANAPHRKRREKRADQIQGPAHGALGVNPAMTQGGTLEDEFDELAQLQVRKQRADQMDQELEDEFFGEAVIDDAASSVVLPDDPELADAVGFTSMKIINKPKSKARKK